MYGVLVWARLGEEKFPPTQHPTFSTRVTVVLVVWGVSFGPASNRGFLKREKAFFGGRAFSMMMMSGSHETMSLLQDLSDKMSIQTLLRTNSSKSTYKPLSSKSTQGNFIKTEFK